MRYKETFWNNLSSYEAVMQKNVIVHTVDANWSKNLSADQSATDIYSFIHHYKLSKNRTLAIKARQDTQKMCSLGKKHGVRKPRA